MADGSGNTPIRASTAAKAGCISTTGDATHAHKLPKISRLAILFFDDAVQFWQFGNFIGSYHSAVKEHQCWAAVGDARTVLAS